MAFIQKQVVPVQKEHSIQFGPDTIIDIDLIKKKPLGLLYKNLFCIMMSNHLLMKLFKQSNFSSLLHCRFKAKDIPGGVLKGVPDFCTIHIISKYGKIASTRSASRPPPFVHPPPYHFADLLIQEVRIYSIIIYTRRA